MSENGTKRSVIHQLRALFGHRPPESPSPTLRAGVDPVRRYPFSARF